LTNINVGARSSYRHFQHEDAIQTLGYQRAAMISFAHTTLKKPLRKSVVMACASLSWCLAMPNDPAHGQAARRGCDVAVYWDTGYSGEVWRTTEDQAATGPHWTKHITSIIVISGIWDFYADANYSGEVITLPPGAYPFIGDHWKERISSFRCVRATQ